MLSFFKLCMIQTMVLFTIESLFNFSTTVARLWLLSGWLLWCLAATALVATSCSSRSVSGSSATAAAPVTSTSSPTPAFWAVAARRIPLFFASSWTYFWWEDLLFTCAQLSGCDDFLFIYSRVVQNCKSVCYPDTGISLLRTRIRPDPS